MTAHISRLSIRTQDTPGSSEGCWRSLPHGEPEDGDEVVLALSDGDEIALYRDQVSSLPLNTDHQAR
jgi:hypothetical protein